MSPRQKCTVRGFPGGGHRGWSTLQSEAGSQLASLNLGMNGAALYDDNHFEVLILVLGMLSIN